MHAFRRGERDLNRHRQAVGLPQVLCQAQLLLEDLDTTSPSLWSKSSRGPLNLSSRSTPPLPASHCGNAKAIARLSREAWA